MKCAPASVNITGSQAVARTADRTTSRHFCGSRDVITHRSRDPICHMPWSYAISYWWYFGLTKPLSLTVSRYSTSNVTQWLRWPWYDL